MKCSFKSCKKTSCMEYLGKEICWQHWEKICDAGPLENKLLKELGLIRIDGKVVKLKNIV